MLKNSNELEEALKNALIEKGSLYHDGKIKIVEIRHYGNNSDYVIVTVELFKKRHKKPYMVWDLYIDSVRELIFFDRSKFEYL